MENPFEIILQKLDAIEKSIEELKNQNNDVVNETKELFSSIELADHLNLKVSTIYGLVHQKRIPHYKIGKMLSFKKEEIDNWIKKYRVNTKDEINRLSDEYLFKHPLF